MRFVAALLISACAFAAGPAADSPLVPNVLWKYRTRAPIVASPVVDGGMVYVGSHDSTLYALDAATGVVRWKATIGGPVRSTVSVDSGRVFLVGGDGAVRCLDARSGSEKWVFRTGGEKRYEPYGYADYFDSSPAAEGGMVYSGSGDGSVYALDASTGRRIWSFATGDVVHSSPAVHNGKVIVGSFDGFVYSLDGGTGQLAWKFKSVGHRFFPRGEMQGSPVVANGIVYIGGRDYNVYALDLEKGYAHWNRPFPKGWAMALTAQDTLLYIGTSDDDLMVAVDGRTGREIWQTNLQFNIFGGCAFTNGLLVVGTLLGKVHGLDRTTGVVRWSFETDGHTAHRAKYFPDPMRMVKEEFYGIVGTPEGYIRALHELGAVFSRPVVLGDRIIFTSTDGTIYCISRPGGGD